MMIKIDGKKLREALKEKGYNLQEASIAIGFSKNFMSKVTTEGRIMERAVYLIEHRLEIPLERYAIAEPEEKPDIQPVNGDLSASGLAYEDLYSLVYKAVYNAIKDALKEA
jgi:hypothetical protein